MTPTDNEVFEKAALQHELCLSCSWYLPDDTFQCGCQKDVRCRGRRNFDRGYLWRATDLAYDCEHAETDFELSRKPSDCLDITCSAIPCPHFVRTGRHEQEQDP